MVTRSQPSLPCGLPSCFVFIWYVVQILRADDLTEVRGFEFVLANAGYYVKLHPGGFLPRPFHALSVLPQVLSLLQSNFPECDRTVIPINFLFLRVLTFHPFCHPFQWRVFEAEHTEDVTNPVSLLILCIIFLSSLIVRNVSSLFTRSAHLISILVQHYISELLRYFWSFSETSRFQPHMKLCSKFNFVFFHILLNCSTLRNLSYWEQREIMLTCQCLRSGDLMYTICFPSSTNTCMVHSSRSEVLGIRMFIIIF